MQRIRSITTTETPYLVIALVTTIGLIYPALTLAAEPPVESVSYRNAHLVAKFNTTVAALAPGMIRTIKVETGRQVSQGQSLARLNHETFAAQYDVATEETNIARIEAENRINIAYALKSAEVNENQLRRARGARTRYEKSISLSDVEQLQLEYEQARLSGEQAELEHHIASRNLALREKRQQAAAIDLERRNICSPLSGRVAQLFVQPGEWVNAGSPIARIIDYRQLRVQGYFAKDYLLRIRLGCEAKYQFQLGTDQFEVIGHVTMVGKEVIDDIFQVWVDIDNSEQRAELVPGLKGVLTIDLPASGRQQL